MTEPSIPSGLSPEPLLDPVAPAEAPIAPGLIRMILTDSLSAGHTIEVPLNGHTLLTGGNGTGKTSLLQLSTLFLGESPNRIAPKSETKKFIPYYLPRTTSYIAFEYRHRSGSLRSVIIHASAEGDALRFRFVRSGLYQDMFETDDRQYVEAVNLARHLRARGYDIAERQIDTLRDYRAIIQGVRLNESAPDRRRFMAMMTADYAVAQAGQPLANIERVVSGMFKKNGSLRELESMVADRILGDDRDVRLSADHRRMEAWPKQFHAYQEVLKMEERARALGAECLLLTDLQARIGSAFDEIRLIQSRDEAKRKELSAERQDLQERRDAETEAHARIRDELQAIIVTLRLEAEQVEKRIATIEEQDRSYGEQDIAGKAEMARRRGALEDEARALRTRIDALNQNAEAIVAAYQRMEETARAESRERQEGFAREGDALRDAHEAEAQGLRNAQKQRLANIREAKSAEIAEAEEARVHAVELHSEAKARHSNPAIDLSLTEALAAAQEAVAKHHEALQAAQENGVPVQETARRARQQFDEALKRKLDLIARKERSDEALQVAMARMKPPAGSLLAFLREQRPDSWGADIGRVVRDDLLTRTDLAPALSEASGSLYGLTLDLEKLSPNPASDQSAEEARIAEIKDTISGLEEQIRAAEAAERSAAEHRALAERALSEQEARLQSVKNHLESAKRILAERKSDVEVALRASRAEAEKGLELAAGAKSQAEAILAAARLSLRQDVEAQEARDSDDLAALKHALAERLAETRDRSAADRAALASHLAELRAEQDRAKQESGIDPAEIRALEDRLAEIETLLQQIRRDEDLVAAWRRFCDSDLKDLSLLRIESTEKRRVLEARQDEHSALKSAWTERKSEIDRRTSEIDGRLRSLGEAISLATTRLLQSDGYPKSTGGMITRRLEEILAELNRDQPAEADRKRIIEQEVRRIASRFRESAGSPPETYLSEAVRSFGREGPEWVPALLHWFDEAHASHRDALLLEARAMANGIKSTYQRLNRLDREIQTTNQRLQRSLNRSLAFEVVSDIGITISSTVQELDYYPAIRNLADMHEAWIESGEALPPESFAEAMEAMLGFLRQGRGVETDLRSQIRLRGYVVENGMRRDFTSSTDLSQVSSNGISYLILMIIFLGFVNMARGDKPLQIVWALDELSNIDANNTARLLRLLTANGITLVAATPESSAAVRRLFDYQVKSTPDRRLVHIEGSLPRHLGLRWSSISEKSPNYSLEAVQKSAL